MVGKSSRPVALGGELLVVAALTGLALAFAGAAGALDAGSKDASKMAAQAVSPPRNPCPRNAVPTWREDRATGRRAMKCMPCPPGEVAASSRGAWRCVSPDQGATNFGRPIHK
jgi:hypothetical protein